MDTKCPVLYLVSTHPSQFRYRKSIYAPSLHITPPCEELVQKLPIRSPNNRRELCERLARELLQIAHRVHQLAVVVRVDAREAFAKVLRRAMLKTPSAAACGAPTAAAANASGSESPSLSVVKMATVWLGERDHKSLNFGKWRRRRRASRGSIAA